MDNFDVGVPLTEEELRESHARRNRKAVALSVNKKPEVAALMLTRAELRTLLTGLSCAVSEATSVQDEQEFLIVQKRLEAVLEDWDRSEEEDRCSDCGFVAGNGWTHERTDRECVVRERR